MARLLRSQPRQPKFLDPPIKGRQPVVTTLSVYPAAGLFVNQRRAQQRRTTTDLRPPTVVFPRATLGTPGQLQLFVYPATGVLTNQRRAQQRRTITRLHPPVVVAQFIANPVSVTSAAVKTRNTNTRRFPVPGWEGWGAIDAFSGFTYYTRPVGDVHPTNGPAIGDASAETALASKLTGVSGVLSYVDIPLRSFGTPLGDILVEIRADSGGSPSATALASALISGATISGGGVTSRASLALQLAAEQTYWIVLSRTAALDPSNFFIWRVGSQNVADDLAYDGAVWGLAGTQKLAWSVGYIAPAGSRSFYSYKRNLGPFPPLVVLPLPSPEVVITPPNVAVSTRTAALRRRPAHFLGGPAALAQPPPVGYAIFVTLAKSRVRRANTTQIRPPTVLQTFATGRVALVSIRPRPTTHRLAPPTVVRVPSVEQREQTIGVSLVRLRPRATRSFLPETIVATAAFTARPISISLSKSRVRRANTTLLRPPTALTTFAAGRPALVSARPRPTIHRLAPPIVIRIPAVEQREQTIGVSLARIRPRPTRALLPETIVAAAQFTAEPISVALTKIRPRRTARALSPPTALQVFSGPAVSRIRTRPRATVHLLSPPTVVFIPSVEQQRRTLRTPLVRIRPRPTTAFLNPPTVVRVPSVEQQEDTIKVFLVRARPRHTITTLGEPTVLQTFAGPTVHATRIRPRPTTVQLAPPTVVTVPSVEQAEETIRVALVRARPRPTSKALFEPTVLQVFPGPVAPLVHTRPRPTVYRVDPPTAVRVPSVEQQEDTIRVSLARARPRPTVHTLAAPTALQTFSGPRVALTRNRPRPTAKRLYAPTVVIPTPSQRAQTITVALAGRTRLEMPRRAPIYDLRPPTVIISNPPVVTEITVSEVEPKNRRDQARRFPNQGQRQRLVRETGTTVTNQLRDPFIGPRPPQIIDPLPTQRAQTISEALVAVRTRREIPRHTVGHFLRPPTVVIPLPTLRAQTIQVTQARIKPRHTLARLAAPTVVDRTLYSAPETPLVHTRPRKTTSVLFEPTVVRVPSVEAALRTIHVALVRTRPRPTTHLLAAPTTLRVFAAGRPALTRIRPRHTVSHLGPPPTLKEFFGPVETEVAVSTVTDRRRHLPHSHLSPPTVLAPTVTTIRETLTRTRPRPTTATLSPPTVIGDRFAAAPVTTSLAPGRRPATRTTLGAPTVVDRFVPAPVTVSLAAGRRPAVTVTLSPPTVIAPPPAPVAITISTALAAASTRRRFRTGRSFFPPVLPPYGPAKLPANTGYAVPASTANGDAVPAGFNDGDATPAAATEGRTLPVAESDGKAVPGTATTEGLK